jgi:hypothetical protein
MPVACSKKRGPVGLDDSDYTLWLVKEVSMTVLEAVEVDYLQHSKYSCDAGSHND